MNASLRCFLYIIVFLTASSLSAADLPVPEELIGSKTVAIASIDLASINKEQLSKTLTAALGPTFDPKSLDQFGGLRDQFKAAGGTSISIVFNMTKGENTDKGTVLVVGKTGTVKGSKLTELLNQLIPNLKEKMSPDSPVDVGDSLAWHQNGFKLPKADEDQAQLFTDAFDEIDENQAITVVLMPDEDAIKTASATMKPGEAELVNAVCNGGGICISSDFGMVESPALRVLVLAPDAKGATTIKKSVDELLSALKTDVPPPVKALLDSLEIVKAGTNVQVSLGFTAIVKGLKDIAGSMMQPPPGK